MRKERLANFITKARAGQRRLGCELIGTYYTMGLYDRVSVIEAPNDATVMKTLLSFESQEEAPEQ